MIRDTISRLVKGKKSLWDFEFPQKVIGRKTHLGGLGDKAITVKLATSPKYPHMEFKGFLMWRDEADWTSEERALVDALLEELDSKSSSS